MEPGTRDSALELYPAKYPVYVSARAERQQDGTVFTASQRVPSSAKRRRTSAKNHENRDSNLARMLLKYQVKSYLVPGRGLEFSLQAIDSKEINLSV
jgi:hypothetical protein